MKCISNLSIERKNPKIKTPPLPGETSGTKESTSPNQSLLFLLSSSFPSLLNRIYPSIYLWHSRPCYRQEDKRNVRQAPSQMVSSRSINPLSMAAHVGADHPPQPPSPPQQPPGLRYSWETSPRKQMEIIATKYNDDYNQPYYKETHPKTNYFNPFSGRMCHSNYTQCVA